MIPRIRPKLGFEDFFIPISHKKINHETVFQFETEFAEYIGTNYAIAVNSARLAFYIILKSIGVKKGDEVILPSLTCSTIVDPVLELGATPVLVDSLEDTYNIDPNAIYEAISQKTKAILPVHLYGNPCDMKRIVDLAKGSDALIIEDCAQALGAEYMGRKAGSIGDAAIFSFDFDKNMTTGGGGMITTDDEKLYLSFLKTIDSLSLRPPPFNFERKLLIKLYKDYLFTDKIVYSYIRRSWMFIERMKNKKLRNTKPKSLSFPFLMGPLRSAVGLSQLKKLDKINDTRINNAKLLYRLLGNNSYLRLPSISTGNKHVFLRFNAVINEKCDVTRDKLSQYMISRGFEVVPWVFSPPVHQIPPYDKLSKFDKSALKKCEKISSNLLNFPTHPHLTKSDIYKLSNLCNKFIS